MFRRGSAPLCILCRKRNRVFRVFHDYMPVGIHLHLVAPKCVKFSDAFWRSFRLLTCPGLGKARQIVEIAR